MRIDSFADKLCASVQEKVAFHSFPNDMKLVASQPHVRIKGYFALCLHRADRRNDRRKFQSLFSGHAWLEEEKRQE